MKTFTFDLYFENDSKSKLPHPAISQVILKLLMDKKFITPECVTSTEFDYQIDALIEELESIKTTARKKYASDQLRQQKRSCKTNL